MELTQSPTLVLANALAAKIGAIPNLSAKRRRIGPAVRSMARVFPARTTYVDDEISAGQMGTIAALQGYAISQWVEVQFEIGLRVTDLNDSGLAIAFVDAVHKQVTGFLPYYGTGAGGAEITPFRMVGSSRRRGYVLPGGEAIQEMVLTASCRYHTHNGIPPLFTPNPEEDLDLEMAVDVMDVGSDWQLVAGG